MIPNQLTANDNRWQRLILICERSIQKGRGWVYPKSHPGLINPSPSYSWNDQHRAPLYFVVSHVAVFRMIGIDTCPCQTLAMGPCKHGTRTVGLFCFNKDLICRQKIYTKGIQLSANNGTCWLPLLASMKLLVLEVPPTNDHGITSRLRFRYSGWLYKGNLLDGRVISSTERGRIIAKHRGGCKGWNYSQWWYASGR